MVAQQTGVLRHVPLTIALIGRVISIEEGLEGRLGVDHHLLASGHVDDQVRPHRAIGVVHGHLLGEVAVAHHAGHLDNVAKLHLTPATARLRLSQGGNQRAGLTTQPILGDDHRPQLLVQLGGRLQTVAVEPLQPRVHLAELLRDRCHQLSDGLLALFELAAGLALVRAECLLRQRQELLVVALERVRRQRPEAILRHCPFAFQPALEPGALGGELVALPAQRGRLDKARPKRSKGECTTDCDSHDQPQHVETVPSQSPAPYTGRTKDYRREVGRSSGARCRGARRSLVRHMRQEAVEPAR